MQTASGINEAEATALSKGGPQPPPQALPCQALDHASGYFMAAGAMAALARRATEGGCWHIRVSLARTGRWLQGLGQMDNGFDCDDPGVGDVNAYMEQADSGFGTLTAVRHAAQMSETTIDQPPDIEVCFHQIMSQSFHPREKFLGNDQNISNQQLFRFSDSETCEKSAV